VDIAVDPLEGTSITAKGGPNAIATVALAEKGGFLHAPDIYMDKLAIGPGLPEGIVDLDAKPEENLRELARAKKCDIGDLMVCTLDRDRHKEMIRACRAAGARIMLLGDGDVSGVIAVSQPEAGVDIYMGSGGAPEGVLAAAALRAIGGQRQLVGIPIGEHIGGGGESQRHQHAGLAAQQGPDDKKQRRHCGHKNGGAHHVHRKRLLLARLGTLRTPPYMWGLWLARFKSR
jgi:fructose-1,6-bisphosphatase/sedoheptulose 1,7-bisphosphatase-like protein